MVAFKKSFIRQNRISKFQGENCSVLFFWLVCVFKQALMYLLENWRDQCLTVSVKKGYDCL